MAVSEEIQRKVLEEATSATPNYDIDYSDERFSKVESEKSQALTEIDQTYGGIINDTDKYYDKQIQASKDWADKQAQLQQENTDFAIEKIEQQKDQAQKDYLKEQSGAYVDWRKQSNQYGTEAEKMASSGLSNTGFSESSQVSMYNTYQNRVATARESYNNAVLNYNNAIKDAQLQNNAALAEIAYNALQQQLELSLQGFQYKNSLVIEKANKKLEVDNIYYNRYQDVLQQINTENALKEDIRQYTETMNWNTEQAELNREHELNRDELQREFEAKEAELDREHDLARDKINNEFAEKLEGIKHNYDIKLLNAKTEKEKELAKQEHELELEKLKKQQEYALAQLDKELANEKALYSYQKSVSSAAITGSSGSSDNSGYISYSKNSKTGNIDYSAPIGPSNKVSTAYYQGTINSDAGKYGTFSNGYQPKGISGHGTLTKTGKTVNVHTTIQYGGSKGQNVTVKQNIWKAEDGTKWIWDGRNNKYVSYNK